MKFRGVLTGRRSRVGQKAGGKQHGRSWLEVSYHKSCMALEWVIDEGEGRNT